MIGYSARARELHNESEDVGDPVDVGLNLRVHITDLRLKVKRLILPYMQALLRYGCRNDTSASSMPGSPILHAQQPVTGGAVVLALI